MKKTICALILTVLFSSQANAGAMTNSATESTQILNNIELVAQYLKQCDQYIRQGLQYQTQLQNLISAQSPGITDVIGIINGISQIMSVGKSIGGSMADIDRNFANTFKSSVAASLADNFTKWNNTGLDTLQGALKAAGKHRDQYASDAAMLQDLYQSSQSTMGARDSIQMLSAIASEEVNQMHKLSDLMSTQNIAASTYMANVTDQSNEQIKNDKAIRDGFDAIRPANPAKLDTTTRTYKPLNIYGPK